jgi:hypothetical protein
MDLNEFRIEDMPTKSSISWVRKPLNDPDCVCIYVTQPFLYAMFLLKDRTITEPKNDTHCMVHLHSVSLEIELLLPIKSIPGLQTLNSSLQYIYKAIAKKNDCDYNKIASFSVFDFCV